MKLNKAKAMIPAVIIVGVTAVISSSIAGKILAKTSDNVADSISNHLSEVKINGSDIDSKISSAITTSEHGSDLKGYQYRASPGIYTTVSLEYFDKVSNFKTLLEDFNQYYSDSEVLGVSGELETVQRVIDYVRSQYNYNETYAENSLSVEESFKKKEGSCQQLSIIAEQLLDHFGIPTIKLVGTINSKPHMWLMADIKGKAYYVDVSSNREPIMYKDKSSLNYKISNSAEEGRFINEYKIQ